MRATIALALWGVEPTVTVRRLAILSMIAIMLGRSTMADVERMPLEGIARSPGQQPHPGGVLQRHDRNPLGQRAHHLDGEDFDRLGHAEKQVGVVERLGVRRPHRVGVRRSRALHQELWRPDARHDAGHQGVQGLDRDDNLGLCHGRRCGKGRQAAGQNRHQQLARAHPGPPLQRRRLPR
jgi:hypothetical protein